MLSQVTLANGDWMDRHPDVGLISLGPVIRLCQAEFDELAAERLVRKTLAAEHAQSQVLWPRLLLHLVPAPAVPRSVDELAAAHGAALTQSTVPN